RVDDEDDVFAVDRDAADLVLVDRRAIVREEPLHLLGQLLLRLREAPGELRRDLGVVLAVHHLRANPRELPLELRDDRLLALHLIEHLITLALHDLRVLEDVLELLLVAHEQLLELGPAFLDPNRLEHLRDHQKQDHGSESAADAVDERKAHRLRLTAITFSHAHGQSSAGASIEPPVLSASSQYAGAASGSPSIASRITLTGTFTGNSRIARSKCCARSRPLTPGRLGATLPIVGNPSTIR